jgi:hypothetical protein
MDLQACDKISAKERFLFKHKKGKEVKTIAERKKMYSRILAHLTLAN